MEKLIKTSPCLHCGQKLSIDEIETIATTRYEGLFEMHCKNCQENTIVTVHLTQAVENTNKQFLNQQKISHNDVLDLKNFLSKFDGNFKNLFTEEK